MHSSRFLTLCFEFVITPRPQVRIITKIYILGITSCVAIYRVIIIPAHIVYCHIHNNYILILDYVHKSVYNMCISLILFGRIAILDMCTQHYIFKPGARRPQASAHLVS